MNPYSLEWCLKVDEMFFRNVELEQCKTEEQKDRLKDRWVIKDAAREISRAISSHNKRGLFW